MTTLPPARAFTSSTATGAMHAYGAHVTAWQPLGEEPVLWMSARSAFAEGSPIRGGVPICFPWFGAGRTGAEQPIHGFARVSTWSEVSTDERPDDVTVSYALTADVPGPLSATYTVTFGAELDLRLAVTNTGSAPFDFEEALHTYLAVGDVRKVRVVGLDGASYLDRSPAGGPVPVVQQGDVTITAETDRLYTSTADVTIVDPVLRRELLVHKTGSANTVVWNPWVAKSAAMADFGDDEWPGMLCVEAANALDRAIVLQPGETHTLGYHLSVRPL